MSHDVRVMATVPADPATTFRLFTEETDLWWRRGLRFRFTRNPRSVLRFEPGVGGCLVEIDPDDESAGHLVGRIRVWEPGLRLVFEWRLPNFAAEESTEVEVRFEASGAQTRVTIEHRGLRALRPDHPARHGQPEAVYLATLGRWWGDLATGLRERIRLGPGPSRS